MAKKKTVKPKSKKQILRKKPGRPTVYTQELADAICRELANGISLRSVLRGEGMPDGATFFKWMREIDGFSKQYEAAKEESADALIEDMLEIADEALPESKSGDAKRAGAKVAAQRLRVDTRKWAASKLKPKKYGDKLDLTSDGKQLKGNTIVFKGFDEKSGTESGSE